MKPTDLTLSKSKFAVRKLRFSEAPWNDDHIARLLSLSASFYIDIKAARADLELKNTTPYYTYNPNVYDKKYSEERRKNPNYQPPGTEVNVAPNHLQVLRAMVAAGKLERLDQAADTIITKYKLPPRWQFPIEVLILSDTLTTPLHGPIYQYVNLPGFQVRLASEVDLPITPEIDPAKRFASKSFWTHPNLTIIVNENMSLRDFTDRLKADPEIKQALAALPKYPRSRAKLSKTQEDEQHWGYTVWVLKQDYSDITFPEIEEKLDETLPEDMVSPSYNELSTYYNRFIKQLAQFEPPNN